MNISEAKEQVLYTMEAYSAKDERGNYLLSPEEQRPLFLMGPPGIGKTAIVKQAAEELGLGLVCYSITHHTRQCSPRWDFRRSYTSPSARTSTMCPNTP